MKDEAFKKGFEELNAAQRKAVETIDGPVLVIAGPGTGKTQLLSMRVANILKSTDTAPENILCLTFTNKAAVNMKERIIGLAGRDGAKIVVKTFHSFAAEIMNLYPDQFWNAAKLSVAPESVQLDVIESIVKELPLDNPLALKFAGQYTLLGDIQRAINLTKDAGLTPDKLRAIITANLAYINVIESELVDILSQRLSAKNLAPLAAAVDALPKQNIDTAVYPLRSLLGVLTDSLAEAITKDSDSGKTTNTSKWKSRWVQTIDGSKGMFGERSKNAWWLELSNVYEKYREAIHQRGFYDYADMLVEVVAQLEQNSEMRASVQERFNYVLIDEFQDTNPAQLRLAHLVTDHHSLNGRPNLMVVGDDDQSIFKFNGAELNNMLGFRGNYETTTTIILTKNYRSTQAVLDIAKSVIEQAGTRLVNSDTSLDKNLVAERPPKEKGKIRAVSYSSRELQLSEIARDIQKNYQPNVTIAVLARGHDSLKKMAGILSELHVPVRYEQQSNVLDHEIVNQVYLLVSLLGAIQNGDKNVTNALVHQIIRHPLWGIIPSELWSLAADNYMKQNWLDTLLASENESLSSLGNWFVSLAQVSTAQPLGATVEQLLGLRALNGYTSPIRQYFLGDKKKTGTYFHSLSAIQLLRSLVHEFASSNEPTLAELGRFIEINKANNKVIADESPFITGDHAVQLLTVHKAKGLEFDHVYIIDTVESNWQPRKGSRKPPANLPLQPVGDDFDDYVRLMYVAMTRAKSSITISSYYQDHTGKEVSISPIIQGAFEIERRTETNKQTLVAVLEENLRWPDLDGSEEAAILSALLESYSLSVTHLLNFLDITRGGPQYFKERNLLRLPEAKTVNLAYGTAIHESLEVAQRLVNQEHFDLSSVQDAFSNALTAEQLPIAEFKRFEKQGRETLKRLFQSLHYELPKGSLPEQRLKDIVLGKATLRGNLDRVDFVDRKLRIVDYKTGSPLQSFDTMDQNKALKAYRHRTQLTFYAILTRNHPSYSKYSGVEGQMVYVEAESARDLTRNYTPTAEDIDHLEKLIATVWRHIKSLDFPDIAKYPSSLTGIKQFEADLLKI